MPDIKTLAAARNVDLVDTFTKSITKLSMMLSACEPIKAAAGETLHHKKITGKLATEEYIEGKEIPVSTYTWADVTTYEVDIKPYRKQTPLQEIKKRGYDAAVDKTDAAMLSDIQRDIKKSLVGVLGGEGVTAVTGKSLTATAATAWATLSNAVEDYGFDEDLFDFYTDESGLISVSHSATLNSITYDTVAYTGFVFFAEYVDFIVKGTIAATA